MSHCDKDMAFSDNDTEEVSAPPTASGPGQPDSSGTKLPLSNPSSREAEEKEKPAVEVSDGSLPKVTASQKTSIRDGRETTVEMNPREGEDAPLVTWYIGEDQVNGDNKSTRDVNAGGVGDVNVAGVDDVNAGGVGDVNAVKVGDVNAGIVVDVPSSSLTSTILDCPSREPPRLRQLRPDGEEIRPRTHRASEPILARESDMLLTPDDAARNRGNSMSTLITPEQRQVAHELRSISQLFDEDYSQWKEETPVPVLRARHASPLWTIIRSVSQSLIRYILPPQHRALNGPAEGVIDADP